MALSSQSKSSQLDECLALFSKCQRKLFCYIVSLVGNANYAEEILQEVSVVVWQKLDNFTPSTDFQAWVFQITYFEIKKHQARKRRAGATLSDEVLDRLADDYYRRQSALDEQIDALSGCIDKLTEGDRHLIEKVYTDEVRVDDLAQQLNRHKQSVYRSLARIRQLLLNCVRRAQSEGVGA